MAKKVKTISNAPIGSFVDFERLLSKEFKQILEDGTTGNLVNKVSDARQAQALQEMTRAQKNSLAMLERINGLMQEKGWKSIVTKDARTREFIIEWQPASGESLPKGKAPFIKIGQNEDGITLVNGIPTYSKGKPTWNPNTKKWEVWNELQVALKSISTALSTDKYLFDPTQDVKETGQKLKKIINNKTTWSNEHSVSINSSRKHDSKAQEKYVNHRTKNNPIYRQKTTELDIVFGIEDFIRKEYGTKNVWITKKVQQFYSDINDKLRKVKNKLSKETTNDKEFEKELNKQKNIVFNKIIKKYNKDYKGIFSRQDESFIQNLKKAVLSLSDLNLHQGPISDVKFLDTMSLNVVERAWSSLFPDKDNRKVAAANRSLPGKKIKGKTPAYVLMKRNPFLSTQEVKEGVNPNQPERRVYGTAEVTQEDIEKGLKDWYGNELKALQEEIEAEKKSRFSRKKLREKLGKQVEEENKQRYKDLETKYNVYRMQYGLHDDSLLGRTSSFGYISGPSRINKKFTKELLQEKYGKKDKNGQYKEFSEKQLYAILRKELELGEEEKLTNLVYNEDTSEYFVDILKQNLVRTGDKLVFGNSTMRYGGVEGIDNDEVFDSILRAKGFSEKQIKSIAFITEERKEYEIKHVYGLVSGMVNFYASLYKQNEWQELANQINQSAGAEIVTVTKNGLQVVKNAPELLKDKIVDFLNNLGQRQASRFKDLYGESVDAVQFTYSDNNTIIKTKGNLMTGNEVTKADVAEYAGPQPVKVSHREIDAINRTIGEVETATGQSLEEYREFINNKKGKAKMPLKDFEKRKKAMTNAVWHTFNSTTKQFTASDLIETGVLFDMSSFTQSQIDAARVSNENGGMLAEEQFKQSYFGLIEKAQEEKYNALVSTYGGGQEGREALKAAQGIEGPEDIPVYFYGEEAILGKNKEGKDLKTNHFQLPQYLFSRDEKGRVDIGQAKALNAVLEKNKFVSTHPKTPESLAVYGDTIKNLYEEEGKQFSSGGSYYEKAFITYEQGGHFHTLASNPNYYLSPEHQNTLAGNAEDIMKMFDRGKNESWDDYINRLMATYLDTYQDTGASENDFDNLPNATKEDKKNKAKAIKDLIQRAITIGTEEYEKTGARGGVATLHRYPSSHGKDEHHVKLLINPELKKGGALSGDDAVLELINADFDGDHLVLTLVYSDGTVIKTAADTKNLSKQIRTILDYQTKGVVQKMREKSRTTPKQKPSASLDFEERRKRFSEALEQALNQTSEQQRGRLKESTGLLYNAYETVAMALKQAGLDESTPTATEQGRRNHTNSSIVRGAMEAFSQEAISGKKSNADISVLEKIADAFNKGEELLDKNGRLDKNKLKALLLKGTQKKGGVAAYQGTGGSGEEIFKNRINVQLSGVGDNEIIDFDRLIQAWMELDEQIYNDGKGTSVGYGAKQIIIRSLADLFTPEAKSTVAPGIGNFAADTIKYVLNTAKKTDKRPLSDTELNVLAQDYESQKSQRQGSTGSGTSISVQQGSVISSQLVQTNLILSGISAQVDNVSKSVKGKGGNGESGKPLNLFERTQELRTLVKNAVDTNFQYLYPTSATTVARRALPSGFEQIDYEPFREAVAKGKIDNYYGYAQGADDKQGIAAFKRLREGYMAILRGNLAHTYSQAISNAEKQKILNRNEEDQTITINGKTFSSTDYLGIIPALIEEAEHPTENVYNKQQLAFLKTLLVDKTKKDGKVGGRKHRDNSLQHEYSVLKEFQTKTYFGEDAHRGKVALNRAIAAGLEHSDWANNYFTSKGGTLKELGQTEEGILLNTNGQVMQGFMDALAFGKMENFDKKLVNTLVGVDLKNPNSRISAEGMIQALEYYDSLRELQQIIQDPESGFKNITEFRKGAYGKTFKQVTGKEFSKDLFNKLLRAEQIKYGIEGIDQYGNKTFKEITGSEGQINNILDLVRKVQNNPLLYNSKDLEKLLEGVFTTSGDPRLYGKSKLDAFDYSSEELNSVPQVVKAYKDLLTLQEKINELKLLNAKYIANDNDGVEGAKELAKAYDDQAKALEEQKKILENRLTSAKNNGYINDETKKAEEEYSRGIVSSNAKLLYDLNNLNKNGKGGTYYRGGGKGDFFGIDRNVISWVDRLLQGGTFWKFISLIRRGITQVTQKAKELDKAMTNLRIVTNESGTDAKTAMSQYARLAEQLGSTTVEVTNSAVEWMRQGYEAAEVNDLITASMHLSTLGMISSTSATKDLTSALKGFKLEASEAMSVVDKLTAIDLQAATSAGEIAEGLAQFANLAQLSGVDIDQASAYVATIADVTQASGTTVGTALKTIISRYGNVKAGAYNNLDTTTDDNGENTTDAINDVEKVLKKLNISIRDSKLEFKDFDEVLDEIADKWGTLDSVSKKAVAVAFAGVRQQESFVTLMNNYDNYQKLLETSKNSTGTAETKFQSYKESYEASKNALTASFEEMVNSAPINNILTQLTYFAKGLVDLLETLVPYLPGIIAQIEGVRSLFGKSVLQTAVYRAKDWWNGKDGETGFKNSEQYKNSVVGLAQSAKKENPLWNDWHQSKELIKEYKKQNSSLLSTEKGKKQYKEELGLLKTEAKEKKKLWKEENKRRKERSKTEDKIVEKAKERSKTEDKIVEKAKKEEQHKDNVEESSRVEEQHKDNVEESSRVEEQHKDNVEESGNAEVRAKKETAAIEQNNANKKPIEGSGGTGNSNTGAGNENNKAATKGSAVMTAASIIASGVTAAVVNGIMGTPTHSDSKGRSVESSEGARNAGRPWNIMAGLTSAIPIIGNLFNIGFTYIGKLVAGQYDYIRDQAAISTENANSLISSLNSLESSVNELGELDFESSEFQDSIKQISKDIFSEDNKDVRLLLDTYLGSEGGVYKVLQTIQDNTKDMADRMKAYRQLQVAQLQAEKDQISNKYATSLYESQENTNSIYAKYKGYTGINAKTVGTSIGTGVVGAAAGAALGVGAVAAGGAVAGLAGTGTIAGMLAGAGAALTTGPWGLIVAAALAVAAGVTAAVIAGNAEAEKQKLEEARQSEWNKMSLGEKIADTNGVLAQAIEDGNSELIGQCEELLTALQQQNSVVNQMLDEINEITLQQGLIAAYVGEESDGKYLSDLTIAQLKNLGIDDILLSYAKAIEQNGGLVGKDVWTDENHTTLSQAGYVYLFNKLRSQNDEEINAVLNGQAYTLSEVLKLNSNNSSYKGQRWVTDLLDSFSNALDVPTEQLQEIESKFGELTLNEMLMSTSDLTDHATELIDLIGSINEGAGQTSVWMKTMISQFPELIAYTGNLTVLYSKIGEKVQQLSAAYVNSQYEDIVSNERVFKEIKEDLYGRLTSSQQSVLDRFGTTGVTSITDIMSYLKTQYQKDGSLPEQAQGILDAVQATVNEYGLTVTSDILKEYYDRLIEFRTQVLDNEINNLTEQKEALQGINQQREYENQLIEAKLKLENASKEKKRVYRAGIGWVYESDQEAIKEAQKNLEEVERQKTTSALENQIATLQQEKDELSSIYDQQNYENLQKFYEAYVNESSKNEGNVKTAQQFYVDMVKGVSGISTSLLDLIQQESEKDADDKTKALAKAEEAWKNLTSIDDPTKEAGKYNTALEEYHTAANAAKNAGAEKSDFEKFTGTTQTTNAKQGEKENAWEVLNGDITDQQYSVKTKVLLPGEGDKHWEGRVDLADVTDDPTILTWLFQDLKGNGGYIITSAGKIIRPRDNLSYQIKDEDDDLKEYADRMKESHSLDDAVYIGYSGKNEAVWYHNGVFYRITSDQQTNGLTEVQGALNVKDMVWPGTVAAETGTLDLIPSLINERGTEAIITPSGTITALPTHTGIVPADITRNLWALGEVAPSIMRTLEYHLVPDTIGSSNISSNTDESFNISNLTMNVTADEGFDVDVFVDSIKQRVALTRNLKR